MSTGTSSRAVVALTQVPAGVSLPGIIPNFNKPGSYKYENIILPSVVLAITTVVVSIRLYARAIIERSIGVA